MASHESYESSEDTISLPRAVRFPVELVPPPGFDPERVETWPQVAGRLEWVEGRLLFMPPCGDLQQHTVADIVISLGGWVRAHPEFTLGTNEAGMRLGDATRAADAAIWRRTALGDPRWGLQRVPPVLAVEVGGQDEPEGMLREKAQWYLRAGVAVAWLVLPEERAVVVLTPKGESRHGAGERIPAHPALPGLTPLVDEFFLQISSRKPRE